MKIKLSLIFLTFLMSCDTPEQIKKDRELRTKDITVYELKTLTRGVNNPEYYIIDTNRNSYETYPEDYVRLHEGDSIQIETWSKSQIVKIYK